MPQVHRSTVSVADCYCPCASCCLPTDPGTRPGLHGQTLISSGHPDLDRLLGGGVPLGSLLLLLEDGWSGHHATLIRYFLAEGAACGQVRLDPCTGGRRMWHPITEWIAASLSLLLLTHPCLHVQTLLLAAAPTPLGGLPKYLPAQLRGKAAEKVGRQRATMSVSWPVCC
jgi:elongator complex protein 4